jgi:hypothetical protein
MCRRDSSQHHKCNGCARLPKCCKRATVNAYARSSLNGGTIQVLAPRMLRKNNASTARVAGKPHVSRRHQLLPTHRQGVRRARDRRQTCENVCGTRMRVLSFIGGGTGAALVRQPVQRDSRTVGGGRRTAGQVSSVDPPAAWPGPNLGILCGPTRQENRH